jgi:hypothetical protein
MFKKIGTSLMTLVFAMAVFAGCLGGGSPVRINVVISITEDIDTIYSGEGYTIGPAAIAFKNSTGDLVYNNVPHAITYSQGGVDLSSNPVNAGTYDFRITVTGSLYTATAYVGSFTIGKKTLEIQLADQSVDIVRLDSFDLEYAILNGTEDIKGEVEYSITYDNETDLPTETGEYTVRLVICGDEQNFMGQAESKLDVEDGINPRFTGSMTQTYGDTGGIDITTGFEILEQKITYNGSATVPTDAGTYEVVAELKLRDPVTEAEFTETLTRTLIINPRNVATLGLSVDALNFTGAQQAFPTIKNIPASLAGKYTATLTDWYGDEVLPHWGGEYTIEFELDPSVKNYVGTAAIKFDVLVSFATALEHYQYAENYIQNVAKHFETRMTGSSSPTAQARQTINNIKQKSNGIFYFQNVTMGGTALGINPNIALQMMIENGEISHRNYKMASETGGLGGILPVNNFSRTINLFPANWTIVEGDTRQERIANYKDAWGTYPENLTNYWLDETSLTETTSNMATITPNAQGAIILDFGVNNNGTADYRKQVNKMSGQTEPPIATTTLRITFDKWGRATRIVEIDTSYTVIVSIRVNLEENINYDWNEPIVRSAKNNLGTFTYRSSTSSPTFEWRA